MPWSPGLPSLVLFGISLLSALLAVAVRRNRNERYVGGFVAIVAVIGTWVLSYGVQLGFDSRAAQLPWWQLTLAVAGFIPTAWLLFTLRYAGKHAWLTRPARWTMVSEPIVFAAFVLTNPTHRLIWTDLELPAGAPVRVFAPEFAVGYYVHIAYAYAIIAFGTYLVLQTAARSSDLYRRQAGTLLAAVVPPTAAQAAFTIRASPVPGLDLTPFTFGATVAFAGVSLFRFDLLDRTPIAREAALDVVGNGLVVLDAEGVVVDADERARRVLTPAPEAGTHISTVFPDTPLERLSGTTVEGEAADIRRTYEVQVSPLRDAEGQLSGHSLVLRDVTDRRAYEQRLQVANRVLRHNLRNDMNVVHGLAGRIESGDADDPAAVAAHIQSKVDGVVETSEKVREMTRTEPTSVDEATPTDLATVVEAVVADFDPECAVVLECEVSRACAAVADESALVTALSNLLENAVEHNESDEPWVRVTTGQHGDRTCLRVVDDGPGLPEEEREVLRREAETPLKHSRGLGLWLASWSARAAGGELTLESSRSDGTAVRIDFPPAGRD
ncbi:MULTISPECIES: sensor histidine kinase [Halolamina]|uniref:histidine kinase n=1 Tax=Halolamina pelagica TaxID=699431 RepID=A0A1I5UFC4_9EURY|nr:MULTISPECIES: histidine kinase N-terminal 7TM domain-containing protein [Halolamina]NHX37255.1 PAS domain-containing protein [Halolamina sp. R1-12]SFP93990.1 Signal transduction histidine kinase [Halolamina pelagica]